MTTKTQKINVVGEGTYGCVHKPSLQCANKQKQTKKKDFYEGKISKIGLKNHINTEINEYKTIEYIDRKNEFYPGKPLDCNPIKDEKTLEAIDNCENFKSNDIDNYKLLIMNDGGDNLKIFTKKILEKYKPSNMNPNTMMEAKETMEMFWIEATRLFNGIQIFGEYKVVHHDLKAENIVYNITKNRTNFIDFGLMTNMSNIKIESENSNYEFSVRHFSFPPEMKFINKNLFLDVVSKKKNIENEFADFVKFIDDPSESLVYYTNISDTTLPPIFTCTVGVDDQITQEISLHKNQYLTMLNTIRPKTYNVFLYKCITTIDSYGLALALMYVLNRTWVFLLNDKFVFHLYNLLLSMMNYNALERIQPNDAVNKYKTLVNKYIILPAQKQQDVLSFFMENYDKNAAPDAPDAQELKQLPGAKKAKTKPELAPLEIQGINILPSKVLSKVPSKVASKTPSKAHRTAILPIPQNEIVRFLEGSLIKVSKPPSDPPSDPPTQKKAKQPTQKKAKQPTQKKAKQPTKKPSKNQTNKTKKVRTGM